MIERQNKLIDGDFFGKPNVFANFRFCTSFSSRVEMIAKAGFGGVMLGMNEEEADVDFDTQVKLCNSLNLKICCAHLPFQGPDMPISANKIWVQENDYFNLIEDCLNQCGKHNIKVAVFHLTSGGDAPPPNKIGFSRIEKLCKVAEKNNLLLALENKRNTKHIDEAFEHIDSPSLAFCYDIGHESVYQNNMNIAVRLTKKYPMAMIHLHDNNGKFDEHKLPFDGSIDYSMVKKQLIEANYTNDLLMEPRKDISSMYKNVSDWDFVKIAYEKAIKFQNLFK